MLTLALMILALSAAAADPPAGEPAPAAAKVDMAHDPRMIAALRHANAVADRKCGEGVGGIVDLATKAEAARCRRRIVETAKLDAAGEIEGR